VERRRLLADQTLDVRIFVEVVLEVAVELVPADSRAEALAADGPRLAGDCDRYRRRRVAAGDRPGRAARLLEAATALVDVRPDDGRANEVDAGGGELPLAARRGG
jgi:hypothetical protein